MGILSHYDTLKVSLDDEICFIQMYRPQNNNTINECLIEEMTGVLEHCDEAAKVVVLEGLADVFCFGADFNDLQQSIDDDNQYQDETPKRMYDLWLKLATGPYITVAHVRGKANAGGVGFVAACDVVLADEKSTFSLSELLFGLMPACVLPFLVRRMGFPKANYMTLMTQPIGAEKALQWGLVDACEAKSENLLRKQLLRLRLLPKTGITRYKNYINSLDSALVDAKPKALAANIEVFSDQDNLAKISRYVKSGLFPWE